jgi:hypothetical protein
VGRRGDMNTESAIKVWVACNAKKISQDEFLKRTGFHFSAFGYRNKKLCLKAWKEYHQNETAKFKQIRKKHKECICEDEKNKQANSFRGFEKSPQRLWKCPEHGNCFIDL